MPNNVSVDELKAKAKELRLHIAQTTFNATSGHIGGSLSCTSTPPIPTGTRETASSSPRVIARSRMSPALR